MSTINQIQLPNGSIYDFEDTAAREEVSSKADKTTATASANGLMSAADKKAIDREFFRMVPKGGTYIPENADLNSIEYIKVGNYYNTFDRESKTIKNIPVIQSPYKAFMMYVLSPLLEVYDNESTDQWVYRLRIFITYTGDEIFVQKVDSGATAGRFNYGPWVKQTNSNDLGAVSKIINDHIANKSNPHGVTKAQVGLGNVDNTADSAKSVKYATSAGSANSVAWGNVSGRPSSLPANGGNSSTVNGHTVNADVPSGAKFTDTTYSAATQSADGLMSAADKSKLDGIGAGSNVKSVNGKTGAVTLEKGDVGLDSVANLDQSKAIKSITRDGTTFTATSLDGTVSTFTQQDSSTTYSVATTSANGLMSSADKAKLDGIGAGSNVKSVNGKTGAVSLSKADVGLGNVDNTSDADKPYYKLIGQTAANNKVGHFNFNDASRSLYKIKNFYTASVEGDYFYLAHKKSDYTITATKHFSHTDDLFTANLSSDCDCRIATNLISESDPAILTIVRKNEFGTDKTTDNLTLIFYEDMGQQSNARLKHWKLETMIFTGKDWEWLTVFERTNVSDSINCLWCGLNPKDNWGYLRIKGIRITIYAATPCSTQSWAFGYNQLRIAGMRLLESQPLFSPAEALGALDVAGGTVYGETTFQEGISATSYSGATATSSADGLMSKDDKAKLDGVVDQASQLAKNTAQIETAGTATNAHSVGEYVMISNALYKVTASVAKGDTWTIGTNVTAANVGSEISSLKSDLANKLYPIGSIYMSVNATNPAELFGGTWEQIKGRFLLGAGPNDENTTDFWGPEWAGHINAPAGELGGEATHTLSAAEMPSHAHTVRIWDPQGITGGAQGASAATYGATLLTVPYGATTPLTWNNSTPKVAQNGMGDPAGVTEFSGGGKQHNNMPPYLAVYMWKRIA